MSHSHRAIWCAILIFVAALFNLSTVMAQSYETERITSFHSDIKVNQDGTLEITETIKVIVQGLEIKRGIFRDFPTKYKDSEGNPVKVWFEVAEVRRDGATEPYTTSSLTNGVRIRIGRPEYYLPYGEHVYTIMYRTRRQLGFFEAHDELYWNVTGNGWAFPIDQASARIELPAGIEEQDFRLTAFTGAYGTHGLLTEAWVEGPSVVGFETTAGLGRYEGLTILVQWPKGIVDEPAVSKVAGYWLVDHLMLIAVPLGLLIVFFYFWQAWVRVGRDPEAGFITPEASAPKGLTPTAVYYIKHMRAGNKAFTAALVNMALQGFLRIDEDQDEDYTLVKLGKNEEQLAAEERAIANKLFKAGDTFLIDQDNHATLSAAQSAMKSSLKKQYENVFFVLNTRQVVKGLLLSGLFILVCVILMFIPYVGYKLMIVPAIVGTVALEIVFWFLMPRHTMLGRMTLDKIEGFKLALAGGIDDLGDEHLGSKILVEKNLPFAIALEVHHAWARRFEAAMQAKHEKGARKQGSTTHGRHTYLPVWYHSTAGGYGSGFEYSKFTSNLASTFNSSISAASSAPGSSSGSSGGFSGGGGGGGGGGGW